MAEDQSSGGWCQEYQTITCPEGITADEVTKYLQAPLDKEQVSGMKMMLLLQVCQLATAAPGAVLRDAEIVVIGNDFSVLFLSGKKTDKYIVKLDDSNQVIVQREVDCGACITAVDVNAFIRKHRQEHEQDAPAGDTVMRLLQGTRALVAQTEEYKLRHAEITVIINSESLQAVQFTSGDKTHKFTVRLQEGTVKTHEEPVPDALDELKNKAMGAWNTFSSWVKPTVSDPTRGAKQQEPSRGAESTKCPTMDRQPRSQPGVGHSSPVDPEMRNPTPSRPTPGFGKQIMLGGAESATCPTMDGKLGPQAGDVKGSPMDCSPAPLVDVESSMGEPSLKTPNYNEDQGKGPTPNL